MGARATVGQTGTGNEQSREQAVEYEQRLETGPGNGQPAAQRADRRTPATGSSRADETRTSRTWQ